MKEKMPHERQVKWRSIIEEQEKSGLSQETFCKQQNLKAGTFAYYRGIFRQKLPQTKSADEGYFAKVNIAKPLNNTPEIRLALPNGLQCVLPANMALIQIKELVRTLLSC